MLFRKFMICTLSEKKNESLCLEDTRLLYSTLVLVFNNGLLICS